LISDVATSWQGHAFYCVLGVFQHVTQHIGSYDEEVGGQVSKSFFLS
jgi:hypothetical protein